MKELINPWVIAGTIIFAALILFGLFWLSGFFVSAGIQEYSGEAGLTIIPNPTDTPTQLPTRPPEIATATSENLIQVGGYVKISGTGGSGLRLRDEPSLNGQVDYLGMEDEIFLVVDGPEDRDGYLWWYVQAPANDTRTGWAAANFLQVAQNP